MSTIGGEWTQPIVAWRFESERIQSRRRIFEEKGTLDQIQEKGSLIPYDLIINERNLKLFLLWGHDKGKANEGGHRHS